MEHLFSNFKKLQRVNDFCLKGDSDYYLKKNIALNSPSQATTGGIGFSSQSTQGYQELMKELSNFSQTLKYNQPYGVQDLQTKASSSNFNHDTVHQAIHTNQLYNAKHGTNKSRCGSAGESLGKFKDIDHRTAESQNENQAPKDSFDLINFSSDSNSQAVNLQQSKALQSRLSKNLQGITSHY